MPERIFVSYARTDVDRVRPIVKTFEAVGVSVEWDEELQPGRWRDQLREKIESCDRLVVMLSRASNTSREVDREVMMAWTLQKPIVPVLLESVPTGSNQILDPLHRYGVLAAQLSDLQATAERPLQLLVGDAPIELQPQMVDHIEICGTVERVFDVLTDYPKYPNWHNGVRETQVLSYYEEGGLARRVKWGVALDPPTLFRRSWIRYECEYSYDPPHRIVWWTEPTFMIKEMVGSYQTFQKEEGLVETTCAMRIEPRFRVRRGIAHPVISAILARRLEHLKLRVEST